MERLTKRLEDGRARVINLDLLLDSDKLYELIDRLAAYEDTGLEPEKVAFLKDIVEDAFSDKPDFTNHLRDLIQAEKDGRLVVLPCGEDAELKRNGQTFRADHWNHSLTAFRDAPETKSGKQVALFSIEEAEAALAGKGGKW